MTLEEFANLAGIELVECDPEWGGKFAYITKDYPNCMISGFRTKRAAYKAWLQDTYGKYAAVAIVKLLDTKID
jgi:hypothetical protein